MERFEDEALYGGAAGGGKSEALVIEAVRQVDIPHYRALLLRKTFPELVELIEKSQMYYKRAFPGAKYNESKHAWTFPSGAKIYFGSMQHPGDRIKYQGLAYDFIGFDELTHFTEQEYMYLLARNRPKGPGTRCYMRATANPGNIGHGWVKERFITAMPPMETIWEDVEVVYPDGKTKTVSKSRVFVPAKVFDNEILMNNDPMYVARLASLPEAEKKAFLYGDWDSFSGQYFTEWKNDPEHYDDHKWTHVINPFEVPSRWKIYRSFDWGYRKPFSCGWWAVDYEGTAYRILEFYGWNGTPDHGLFWDNGKIFSEIHRIETEHRWLRGKNITGIADPAIFKENGGESAAETAEKYYVYFEPGDNERIPGWMQMHYRMAFDRNGYSRLYVFKNCKSFIRTIPQQVFDERITEDLDTRGEDHIADETRYFCMSRPIKPVPEAMPDNYKDSPLYQYLDIPREQLRRRRPRSKMEVIKNEDGSSTDNE